MNIRHPGKATATRTASPSRVACIVVVCLLLLAGMGAASASSPPATGTFWRPDIAPSGPIVMVVSLDEQHLYVYRNGVVIGVSPVSSGKPGYETPTGVYTILQKEREHYSNLYDNAPMPYMQRLTWDGVAMHSGALPGHAASHGCIRLPPRFAAELYKATRPGDVVVVANAQVAPSSIVHPSAVAPVDLTGQPTRLDHASGTPALQALDAFAKGPLNIIISTADRSAYVLREGRLVAHAPVAVTDDAGVHGILLYVAESGPATDGALRRHWSGYRVSGSGPVPEPDALSRHIRLPKAFGEDLSKVLRAGTTVLITDLPGYRPSPDPSYGALLQSGTSKAPLAQ